MEANPNDQKTLEYLGDIASNAEDWDTAIEYYKALIEEDDSNANYQYKYGGALGMKALTVNKLLAATYVGDLKFHFEKAASLDPSHIDARWALVELYMQLPGILGGSEEKALEYANQLLLLSPVDGFLAKGRIAEMAKRPADAEKYFKNAVQVGGSPLTYETLAGFYESNDQPQKASEVRTKAESIQNINKK